MERGVARIFYFQIFRFGEAAGLDLRSAESGNMIVGIHNSQGLAIVRLTGDVFTYGALALGHTSGRVGRMGHLLQLAKVSVRILLPKGDQGAWLLSLALQ